MKLKQNKQSKLVIALSAVILLLVALSATLTFAYFTATSNASESTVNFGKLAISLNSTNAETGAQNKFTVDSGHTLVPGCILTMDANSSVQVAQDSIDCYVRIKLEITATKKGETADALTAEMYTLKMAAEGATSNWVAKNGYYYYNGKVAKDSAKATDLSLRDISIEISKDKVGNDWMEGTIKITLTAEAIQADHLVDSSNNEIDLSTFNADRLDGAAAWATVSSNGVKN